MTIFNVNVEIKGFAIIDGECYIKLNAGNTTKWIKYSSCLDYSTTVRDNIPKAMFVYRS